MMERTQRIAMLAVVLTFLGTLLLLAVSTAASAADKDVRLTYRDDQPVKMAQGLNPISFNFSIQHTGMLMSEEVYVYVENEPPYWQHYLTSQTRMDMYFSTNFILVMLQKGEKANVSLTITPYGEELNRTFWMTLNVYPKGASDTNRSCDIGVIIPQTAVFEVRVFNEPEPGYFAAIPPAQVTVRFALFNAGNGNDRFLVRYESSRSDAGWTMRPDGAASTSSGGRPTWRPTPASSIPTSSTSRSRSLPRRRPPSRARSSWRRPRHSARPSRCPRRTRQSGLSSSMTSRSTSTAPTGRRARPTSRSCSGCASGTGATAWTGSR
jgi:hypothetical protein